MYFSICSYWFLQVTFLLLVCNAYTMFFLKVKIMKNLNLCVLACLIVVMPINSVNIPRFVRSGVKQAEKYGQDLLTDGTTQAATVVCAGIIVGGYYYYQHNAALSCLDGDSNSHIMYEANLVHMTYSDFLQKITKIESYPAALEFVDQNCKACFSVSHEKINKFIVLVEDLQANNNKRNFERAQFDNDVLENFKTKLLTVKKNLQDQLLTDAINANKRASNMYTFAQGLEILSNILKFFNGK